MDWQETNDPLVREEGGLRWRYRSSQLYKWRYAQGSLRREQAREKTPIEVLSTFSAKFLKFPRALLALCLLRGELSATSGFLRQMPYKHQSLVFSTLSRHWLSRVGFAPLPYVKGTCFQQKCPLNIQLKLEVIFCMNGFLQLGLKQNKLVLN